MRTAPDLDQLFDPFGPELSQVILGPHLWFTRDFLEDEMGLLGGHGPHVLVVSAETCPVERTSVSRNRQQNFVVVFNASAHGAPCVMLSITGAPRSAQTVFSEPPSLEPLSLLAGGPATQDVSYLESSLAEVQGWLGISLQQAADAAGISRGTVYAWRDRGSVPRPGTVRGILRLHGIVASAVRIVGPDAAREWFFSGDPSPLEQLLDGHGDDRVIRQVSKRLRRELTATSLPRPNPWLAANRVDLSD